MAKKSTMLHIPADKETKAALTREAKAMNVSLAWIVREAISRYLKAKQELSKVEAA